MKFESSNISLNKGECNPIVNELSDPMDEITKNDFWGYNSNSDFLNSSILAATHRRKYTICSFVSYI